MKSLMPVLAVVLIVIGLGGCDGSMSKFEAKITGYSLHCVDGVEYVQFVNGASVKHNRDGSVALCD